MKIIDEILVRLKVIELDVCQQLQEVFWFLKPGLKKQEVAITTSTATHMQYHGRQ